MESIKDILKRYVEENVTDEEKKKLLLDACEAKNEKTEIIENNKNTQEDLTMTNNLKGQIIFDLEKVIEKLKNDNIISLANDEEIVGVEELPEKNGVQVTKVTTRKNNKRDYSEEIVSVTVNGYTIKSLNVWDEKINDLVNKNYGKGQFVSNKQANDGKGNIGIVEACYYGSKGENCYNDGKFYGRTLDGKEFHWKISTSTLYDRSFKLVK